MDQGLIGPGLFRDADEGRFGRRLRLSAVAEHTPRQSFCNRLRTLVRPGGVSCRDVLQPSIGGTPALAAMVAERVIFDRTSLHSQNLS